MKPGNRNKSEQISLRLQPRAKRLIERAAGFEGKTVSHFILSCSLTRAEKTILEHGNVVLTARDAETFFNALTTPVKFNPRLAQALDDHDTHVVGR